MKTTMLNLVLSFISSIDLYNYLLKNHHRRTAIIAWHLGKAYGLNKEQMNNLIIAASLHDIGALTVEERDKLIELDIDNPHPHARLGYYMLNSFDPLKKISVIIFYHHWPYNLDNSPIIDMGPVPIESYLLHLADRIEILIDPNISIMMQLDIIKNKIHQLKGTIFHPDIVDAFDSICSTDTFWLDINNVLMKEILDQAILPKYDIELSIDILEQFAYTCSKVIDCRCRFTASHSFGVSEVAYNLSKLLGYDEEKSRKMRVAGLLHDIGKIGISCELIKKNGPLTETERKQIQTHAYFTNLILKSTSGLEDIAQWASHHHECHDGCGYPDNYMDKMITEEMDVLAYADIFTALTEDRPYRLGMSLSNVIATMSNDTPEKHGEKIFNIINNNSQMLYCICKNAIKDGTNRYNVYEELAAKYELETNEYLNL